MTEWQHYTDTVTEHTIVGDLRVYRNFHSPQFNNVRDIYAWLPASYEASDRRYPVIYMHDGQNLFDARIAHSGEWGVDETLTLLAAEGYEAIVVGLVNMADQRRNEYNPYPLPGFDGRGVDFTVARGDDYIRFLADTVKPWIDATFRTAPAPQTTGIAGSSMGGLISLHGFLTRPDVFGLCGSFSPVAFIGTGLQDTLMQRADGHGRIYLDVGTREGVVITGIAPHLANSDEEGDQVYTLSVRDLYDRLLQRGYRAGENLLYVEEVDALHNEPAWARRLPDALRFLLK